MEIQQNLKRNSELQLQYFQLRHKAKLCVAIVCLFQLVNRIIGTVWDPVVTSETRLFYIISIPFLTLMMIIIGIEHFLCWKRGQEFAKYSVFVDLILFLLFMGDWMTVLIGSLEWLQITNPACFTVSSLYGFTSFSWRTLLVTLIVENSKLKILAPVIAVCVTTGFAIYYSWTIVGFLLMRAIAQLLSIILIVYCEDKVKWKIMWTTFQQEKWMQVNNFILNNIPENIMILDLKGETKFVSDYCQSFMKRCHLSLDKFGCQEFFERIQDLQSQYEAEPPLLSGSLESSYQLPVERLTTASGFFSETNEQKAETLQDLIENFKNLIIQKKLQERQFVVYNGKLKMKNQQDRSLEVKISFIQHFENNFIILILRDMTQRDLLVALEETNKYKDQLLASVSHELRAPLNGNINLMESAISSSEVPDGIKESLLIPALQSSKFLLHMINDILDMSQIKQKKLRLVFESKNLKETLRSAAQLIEIQARKKNIELIVELDSDLPKNFSTDHMRLSQIVLNLLNNGIKFTREGGMVRLTARPMFEAPWVKITIEDSGIGMDQENIKKLFSSYTHIEFQERQAMNSNGVGLGLSIAYNLAELLSPEVQKGINVSSAVNKGSVFSFIIENKEFREEMNNLSNSAEIADELSEGPGGIKPILYSIKRNKSMSRGVESVSEQCLCPKVLIVDDNPFNIMAFETILGSLEIECESVYNGLAAIEKLWWNHLIRA